MPVTEVETMRNRGRGRGAGGRRLVGPATDAAHTILSITDSGTGDLRVTTAAPYGALPPTVVLSGTSVAGYNGQPEAAAIPDTATQFVVVLPYTADASGGTWRAGP